METIFLPQKAMVRRDMEMTDRCDVLGRLDGVGDGTCEGLRPVVNLDPGWGSEGWFDADGLGEGRVGVRTRVGVWFICARNSTH